jgi:hypothetical protein
VQTSHRPQESPAHQYSHFSQNRRGSVQHFRLWHLHRQQNTALQRSSQPIHRRHHDFSTSVLHHIVTTGPTVAERPRRLTGEKLTSRKVEFDFMLQQAACRRSSSLRASPPHPVSKKTGLESLWRVLQIRRSYGTRSLSIARIHDFAYPLCGKTIFTILDLI